MGSLEDTMADTPTPEELREGVRSGILASIQRDIDLRGGRTARLLASAGLSGILGAVGAILLISGHPFDHHPPWHVAVFASVWAGLLVVSLSFAFLRVRTPSLPLARAACVGVLGLGLAGVATRERPAGRAAAVGDAPRVAMLADQAGHLRPREARDLTQVSSHEALVRLAEPAIGQALELPADEAIGGSPVGNLEAQWLTAVEKRTNLLQRLEPFGLEGHEHHLLMIPGQSLQAHFSLESRRPFRLICHWKRLTPYKENEMSKKRSRCTLMACVLMVLPLVASADSGHGDEGHSGAHAGGHDRPAAHATDLAGAWSALTSARDAIAAEVEGGALENVHAKTEPLPQLVEELLERSSDLDAGKRTRVEGAAKQVTRVAEALHVTADKGDAARTRRELGRLDSLLELIRAQYSEGALEGGGYDREGHSAAPGHAQGAHAHMEPPAGAVNMAAQKTVRVEAFDPFRFEPRHIEVQAGVPTRIELANLGVAEHSLVVKTPDGARDWVHLHAQGGATKGATYELDQPGTYPVLCTVPGHTEAGMVGKIVVSGAEAE